MGLNSSSNVNVFVKNEKLRDNFVWFYSNYVILKRDFNNQYVAVKDKTPIDNDCNLEILLRRLKLTNCDESIVIEYIDS